MELKLSEQQTIYLSNKLVDFFSSITDITDYYMKKKHERIISNSFDSIEDSVFNDCDVDPFDMDISIEVIPSSEFNKHVQQIATFNVESQIGRQITIGVKENNSGKYLGFLRISSPISTISPRNKFLGKILNMEEINRYFYNGQCIIPVQPFGYNYLGGKLISLVCCSEEVRQLYNTKYGSDVCVFETTSLYGNSKSNSMYDGLEPYIKNRGLTESKNNLFPTDDIWNEIKTELRKLYGKPEWNNNLVNPTPSSPKMREYSKSVQILKLHLKSFNQDLYKNFEKVMKEKSITFQQKRYYTSTFGFENVVGFFQNKTSLIRTNGEKYELKNLISYWKNKSHNRWTKLKEQNKLKTNLEFYDTQNTTRQRDFEIIR